MMNDNEKYVENFVRSEAGRLLAEVFFRELQFISGDGTLSDRLVVCNHGMNSRVWSQDVLDIQTEDFPNTSKERVVLHLARNGIYHQLPEFLFHPISLSTPSMTNSEVVAAMRANRKKEEETIKFFQPFDTEFFKDGVNMFKRSMSLFDDPCANRILQNVSALFSLQAGFLKLGEKYRLMLFLCKAGEYKENLPALEEVLHTVFHMRVALQYRPHHISEPPHALLGECQADGLIVATPTGSTAYSLSNGGPIIVPQRGSLCLTPVAPHSLNLRPIVINDSSKIDLEVESRSHSFLVAIDGRSMKMADGVQLSITKAQHVVKVVKLQGQSFFTTLREKLMWGVDQR